MHTNSRHKMLDNQNKISGAYSILVVVISQKYVSIKIVNAKAQFSRRNL